MLRLPATPTVATLTAANSIASLTTMPGIPTLAYTTTSLGRVFTPQATNTPWIFPSGLSIEEHPLAKPPEIDRFSHNILFEEKLGGSFHMALGASYPETGGKNKSIIHWDMICGMQKDSEILLDGEVIYKDGKFTF